jgi:multicomponent K+:H+ antiporter subunit D
MLVLTAALALAVLIYAVHGWDAKGRYFHALFQFQLLGINGAFLTGDVFNLFVFFEVMLIASYGLMLHGGGPRRLKAGFHYVAINLIASTLFLFAVGLIYAVTGTLNMADLAVKVQRVAAGDQAILVTGAMLLFVVFAVKAALAPLHWWLPTTYAAAPPPVSALFMIMTKVGVYSILRVHGLIFGTDGAVSGLLSLVVLPAALLTIAAGTVGILASRRLSDVISFATVASMGTLLVVVASFDSGSMTAALYYLVHSTVTGAGLFLLADLIAARRGEWMDRLVSAPAIRQEAVLGAIFFMAAVSFVGLPPLSGFVGKLMILDATRGAGAWILIWSVILGTSVLMVLGFARAGSALFWKTGAAAEQSTPHTPQSLRPIAVAAALTAVSLMLSIYAGPVTRSLQATAVQALDRSLYVGAVLGPESTAAMRGK